MCSHLLEKGGAKRRLRLSRPVRPLVPPNGLWGLLSGFARSASNASVAWRYAGLLGPHFATPTSWLRSVRSPQSRWGCAPHPLFCQQAGRPSSPPHGSASQRPSGGSSGRPLFRRRSCGAKISYLIAPSAFRLPAPPTWNCGANSRRSCSARSCPQRLWLPSVGKPPSVDAKDRSGTPFRVASPLFKGLRPLKIPDLRHLRWLRWFIMFRGFAPPWVKLRGLAAPRTPQQHPAKAGNLFKSC